MNDTWDVKSVRNSGQYMSCMKINGVPLLPPVLSRECREEMQYYKLLAKEVEKRISILQPYIVQSDTESSEDKTDAPELPECEQSYDILQEDGFKQRELEQADSNMNEVTIEKKIDKTITDSPKHISPEVYNNLSDIKVMESDETASSKLIIDLSLSINDTGKNILGTIKNPQYTSPHIYLPERDYNCLNKHTNRELLIDMDTVNKTNQRNKVVKDIVNLSLNVKKTTLPEQFSDLLLNQNGPSSLSSKSFTGSLNDIHTESLKESQIVPKLIRQRSYTLLNPSPQLLAHLEVQSLNTGVEMSCISMSESLSNLSSPSKKQRRSWDLESAKVKWSSMAKELKKKNLQNAMKNNSVNKNHVARSQTKKASQVTPLPRTRSLLSEKPRLINKVLPKSDPIQKSKRTPSPVKNGAPNRATVIESTCPKDIPQKKETDSPKPASQLISESEDPATRVRELYEKIQKQQLLQMAGLVEKQKREQKLLQQVFEEQNNLLYKQLKTICPKSPIDAKEAWGDKHQDIDRGPVSLSQLINHKSPDQSIYDSPVSSTLTDTNNYINHCDQVLKKSRDITGSIKKQHNKSQSQNGTKIQSPRSQVDGSRTRTHSPTQRNPVTSRRLNYDTSASSDREYEPILTDRTNDTMADLNVTFPSDHSEDCFSINHNNTVLNHVCGEEVTIAHTSPLQDANLHCRSTDSAIRKMEKTIQNSINNSKRSVIQNSLNSQPTSKQRAASMKIVAYAKGYLVRRLMRTDRVQATVQTIKDALLCALQLHQDREGIRGADVDLHRRLIQQITAACYTLHDTFVASSPAERCAMIAADRGRRRSLAARQPPKPFRQTDIMSQSFSGAFPARAKRSTASATSLMTQSNYETFSGDKSVSRSRYMPSPRRRPWR